MRRSFEEDVVRRARAVSSESTILGHVTASARVADASFITLTLCLAPQVPLFLKPRRRRFADTRHTRQRIPRYLSTRDTLFGTVRRPTRPTSYVPCYRFVLDRYLPRSVLGMYISPRLDTHSGSGDNNPHTHPLVHPCARSYLGDVARFCFILFFRTGARIPSAIQCK